MCAPPPPGRPGEAQARKAGTGSWAGRRQGAALPLVSCPGLSGHLPVAEVYAASDAWCRGRGGKRPGRLHQVYMGGDASCHFVGSLSLPSLNLRRGGPIVVTRGNSSARLRTAGQMHREMGLGWPDPETNSPPPVLRCSCFIPDQSRRKSDVSAALRLASCLMQYTPFVNISANFYEQRTLKFSY